MLQTVIGPKRDIPAVDALLNVLTIQPWSGSLYIGYPVLALPDGPALVDAFLHAASTASWYLISTMQAHVRQQKSSRHARMSFFGRFGRFP